MIGIICAMQVEADGITALCEGTSTQSIHNMSFTSGRLHGKDVVTVVCGVGKVNAAMCAAVMIERFSPDVIINSGVAGGVSPLVSVGDIVIAEATVEHDMNTTALGEPRGEISLSNGERATYLNCDRATADMLRKACADIDDAAIFSGVIASGDIFVSAKDDRKRINDRFGALACEMEGAAVNHVCVCCGVPCAVIRAISDDLTENEGVDFMKFCGFASQRAVQAIDRFVRDY